MQLETDISLPRVLTTFAVDGFKVAARRQAAALALTSVLRLGADRTRACAALLRDVVDGKTNEEKSPTKGEKSPSHSMMGGVEGGEGAGKVCGLVCDPVCTRTNTVHGVLCVLEQMLRVNFFENRHGRTPPRVYSFLAESLSNIICGWRRRPPAMVRGYSSDDWSISIYILFE